MLLLITGSDNRTSDKIVTRLSGDVFRLNYDLWFDYSMHISPNGWKITNPLGLTISSETVTRAFYWKAFDYPAISDDISTAEIKYAFREIYEWCIREGLLRGNPYYFHERRGKISILSIASKYFKTPDSLFSIGLEGVNETGAVVAKSLSSQVTTDYKALMTTEVSIGDLDSAYPWFLQEKIDSQWDITVFICGTHLFAFKRSRLGLKGLDWRAEQGSSGQTEWFPFYLDEIVSSRIAGLSNDLCVKWGRYDFMLDSNDDLIFLEFNANGQWGFLDPANEYGILDRVSEYLS